MSYGDCNSGWVELASPIEFAASLIDRGSVRARSKCQSSPLTRGSQQCFKVSLNVVAHDGGSSVGSGKPVLIHISFSEAVAREGSSSLLKSLNEAHYLFQRINNELFNASRGFYMD